MKPGFLFTPQVFILSGCSNIWISTPSGAIGCLLKSWAPLSTVHEYTFGCMFDNLNRFTCMFSSGINLSHRPRGKVADTPLRSSMVCAFHVCSAHSARFHLRWPFGTSSYYNSFSFMARLNSPEHSLSSTFLLGLIPTAFRQEYPRSEERRVLLTSH